MTRLRLMIDSVAGSVATICDGCGHTTGIPEAHWLALAEIETRSSHRCGAAGVGVSKAPERMRRFVAERLEVAPAGLVSMEAARDAYDEWPGNEGRPAEYSTFGRWFRQVMPPGVRIERKRIGEERQNWIMGMRLRD